MVRGEGGGTSFCLQAQGLAGQEPPLRLCLAERRAFLPDEDEGKQSARRGRRGRRGGGGGRVVVEPSPAQPGAAERAQAGPQGRYWPHLLVNQPASRGTAAATTSATASGSGRTNTYKSIVGTAPHRNSVYSSTSSLVIQEHPGLHVPESMMTTPVFEET